MLRLNLLLLAAALVCAMGVVASNHSARKLFIELEREQERTRQLEVEWGQLQLEQSTWAAHARVERIARERLHMRLPAAAGVMVAEPPREGQP